MSFPPQNLLWQNMMYNIKNQKIKLTKYFYESIDCEHK